MVEHQKFDCGCEMIRTGRNVKWEYCMLHRGDNFPPGADDKFKKN